MASRVDYNFKEISCDRNVSDSSFPNGLQHFRYSVSAFGGATSDVGPFPIVFFSAIYLGPPHIGMYTGSA